MAVLLFYRKPILLDRGAHAGLRLDRGAGYGFAGDVNSVMLVGEEFGAAARCYPIAFVDIGGGQMFPVAMLGLRARENLFVDANGAWEAGRYVPAFVRRYPFVLTDAQDVCIDEGAPGLRAAEGEPLFDVEGANTPALDQTLAFLGGYQRAIETTRTFVSRLQALKLLTPLALQVALDGEAPFRLQGLHAVDEAALSALGDAETLELVRAGWMGWIAAHRLSLLNTQELATRSRRTPAAAAA